MAAITDRAFGPDVARPWPGAGQAKAEGFAEHVRFRVR